MTATEQVPREAEDGRRVESGENGHGPAPEPSSADPDPGGVAGTWTLFHRQTLGSGAKWMYRRYRSRPEGLGDTLSCTVQGDPIRAIGGHEREAARSD
ncbi:hypothetical protein [Streptomyces alboflavus]|uniref:hypothetical protein n=1 Tax=Streptomyces alboflavus TaxID=67267 RepID=UPI0013312D3B|nr:hypothetical protein [Streptomyces alboflavus]